MTNIQIKQRALIGTFASMISDLEKAQQIDAAWNRHKEDQRPAKPASPQMLQSLQRRINNKFHRV